MKTRLRCTITVWSNEPRQPFHCIFVGRSWLRNRKASGLERQLGQEKIPHGHLVKVKDQKDDPSGYMVTPRGLAIGVSEMKDPRHDPTERRLQMSVYLR